MNFRDENQWALQKFGVGQPVPRTEDPMLVRGEGRYTDDIDLPDQAYAVMVRSQHAHGIIRNIDATEARAMPGVLAVVTGADLAAAGYGGRQLLRDRRVQRPRAARDDEVEGRVHRRTLRRFLPNV